MTLLFVHLIVLTVQQFTLTMVTGRLFCQNLPLFGEHVFYLKFWLDGTQESVTILLRYLKQVLEFASAVCHQTETL